MVAFTASNPDVDASAGLRRKALKTLSDLPPFSATLNRLMATLAGENVSFSQLGDLIEKDTVVAGNILNLVNSALYARRGTINSVRHALSLLGIDKIRNAVLGMSLTRMWSKLAAPPSWSMARFNQHSAAAALLSDQLAQHLTVEYPEGAFVAGLLHDVGRLLIAMALRPEYERIQKMRDRTGLPLIDCEQEVLGFHHATLSADALTVWNIPEPIRVAVLCHHDVDADNSLARMVGAADDYVNSIGVSIAGSVSAGPRRIDSLGLSEDERARVLADFKAEFDVMSQFFR